MPNLYDKQQSAPDTFAARIISDDGLEMAYAKVQLEEDPSSPTGHAYGVYTYTFDENGVPQEDDGGSFWDYDRPDDPELIRSCLPVALIDGNILDATSDEFELVQDAAAEGLTLYEYRLCHQEEI